MEERTFRLLEFFKVLSHLSAAAVSAPGREACLRITPFRGYQELVDSGALLSQALELPEAITGPLSSFPSLDGLFRYLESEEKFLDTDGLWALEQVLGQADLSRKALCDIQGEQLSRLQALGEACPVAERVRAGLKRCLAPDGNLRDESSPELSSVRQGLRDIQKQCTRKINDFLQQGHLNPDHLQDEFLTISSDRYVLALKANFKGRVQGIIHDYSQSGETCYFEPLFLVELNNRLQELRQEERAAEKRVLLFLTGLVRQERDAVLAAYQWLVQLDVLAAKLRLAAAFDGRPVICEPDAAVDLKQARHPLLALEGVGVRPTDIQFRPDARALVISGGNAGGKTVCLKTLGLIALMHLSGLPVPVGRESRLPFLKKVFVFLGDEQSLEDHLSTFTAQIGNLRRFWPDIDSDTLVILDEFGAGTDPSQGAALAQAVLDELLTKKALVGAATHFPALKAYAMATEGVRAASVLFDPETGKPLYRLAYDQVGASRALDVAREHGLPEPVLKRAEEYLLLDGEDSARLLDRLNALVVVRERELEALEQERLRLNKEHERLKARYAAEAKAALEESKALSQQILREWKAGRTGRRTALKRLARSRSQLEGAAAPRVEEQQGPGLHEVASGDWVFYPAWSKKGVVQEKDARKGRLKVDFGGLSLWVDPRELRLAGQEKAGQPGPAPRVPAADELPVRLDLRGQRAEEAAAVLNRFLDRSVMQGRRHLEIIHGKGTGALREVVQETLEAFPGVESFGLAPEGQGGDGVTLVTL